MIDPILRGVVGANLHADNDIRTEHDYKVSARNTVRVLLARKIHEAATREQLEKLLKAWHRPDLDEFTGDTHRDWFLNKQTEAYLRVVIEEMIQELLKPTNTKP